ncbi:AMED_5909 family protein [Actinosynnema sp. NPDC020468]|uniref:AMED_5909 family protein n=1 Tax=Actinosynnema sp. NPDC020468 TaxID=3154488 RepID=UPI0033C4A31A
MGASRLCGRCRGVRASGARRVLPGRGWRAVTTPRRNLWKAASEVTTLMQAHELLSRLMPAPDSEPGVLRAFYLRSAKVYLRVAEVDRGHHHEALYWAVREREKGEEIGDALPSEEVGG